MMELHQFVKLEAIFQGSIGKLVCAIEEQKSLFCPTPPPTPPPVYQNLSTHHDWPVKKATVDLPIKMKRNSKRTSSAALQTLLTDVKLCLRYRPPLSLLFLVSSQTDKKKQT